MRILRVLSLLSLFSLPAFCGTGTVTIVYTGISATPTLSQTMLIALALLLPVIAFRTVRKVGQRFMALAVAAGLAALEGLTGRRFLPSAQAAIPVNIDLSSPTGGTVVQAINFSQFLVVRNTTGVNLVIRSITTVTSGNVSVPLGVDAGVCVVGQTLAPSASCFLGYD